MQQRVLGFLLVVGLITNVALGAGCGSSNDDDSGKPRPGFSKPDLYCPGSPGCTGQGGEAQLQVGAGAQVFTPQVTETWTDEDGDFGYDPGEPYVDANGNGRFDPIWLFGGEAANGIKTDIEARAIAFKQHDTLVVICYLDVTGMLMDDYELIRADPELAGLDIDHVVLGAVHAHATPDTIGISNQNELETGYDPAYVATVRAAAVQAIKEAVMSLAPAKMIVAQTLILNDPEDPNSKTDHFNKDIRDPVIYDPTLTIARFVHVDAPTETIATLVHWADHPEVSVFEDSIEANYISAHFPHWLRNMIEDGAPSLALAGLGGTTVYMQGPLGGQIGSIRNTVPIGIDGVPVTEESHAMDQAIGESVAVRALEALAAKGETVDNPELSFRTTMYVARVDNTAFQTAFIAKVITAHQLFGYDEKAPMGPGNEPWMNLRATYVQLGPLGLVTNPGELHPELWVGGYDGSWSWGNPILNPEITENVPDLSTAPDGPYLRDLVLTNPGVKYPVCLGLAEDYIGYIVPEYNFVLDETLPYLEEAEGDHYEETYALGPEVETHAVHPILELVKWRAP